MNSWNSISRRTFATLAIVASLCAAVALYATAQEMVITPKAKTETAAPAPANPAPAYVAPSCSVPVVQPAAGQLRITALDDSTAVVTKDFGAAQTVMVYKVDDIGKATLTFPPPNTPAAPIAASTGAYVGASAVQALSNEMFITVKDHGDSQTVMVYKVNTKGDAVLTHKAKYFYKKMYAY